MTCLRQSIVVSVVLFAWFFCSVVFFSLFICRLSQFCVMPRGSHNLCTLWYHVMPRSIHSFCTLWYRPCSVLQYFVRSITSNIYCKFLLEQKNIETKGSVMQKSGVNFHQQFLSSRQTGLPAHPMETLLEVMGVILRLCNQNSSDGQGSSPTHTS